MHQRSAVSFEMHYLFCRAFEFSLSACFEIVIFDNELHVTYIVLFILAQSQILLGKNSFYKTLDITIIFLKQIFVIKTKF